MTNDTEVRCSQCGTPVTDALVVDHARAETRWRRCAEDAWATGPIPPNQIVEVQCVTVIEGTS